MTNKIKCAKCGYELKLPSVIEGWDLKCPKCGSREFIVDSTLELGV